MSKQSQTPQVNWMTAMQDRIRGRLAVCKTCPEYIELTRQCRECGCFLPAKAAVSSMDCPLDKWPK